MKEKKKKERKSGKIESGSAANMKISAKINGEMYQYQSNGGMWHRRIISEIIEAAISEGERNGSEKENRAAARRRRRNGAKASKKIGANNIGKSIALSEAASA